MSLLPVSASAEASLKKEKDVATGIFSCGFYTLCSVATVIANKYISFGMDPAVKAQLPEMVVILIQCLIALFMVESAKMMKWVDYAPFNLETAKSWVPVNLLFIGMVTSGLISFIYVSVPMITIFKNLTNLVTVAGDWYLFNEQSSWLTILSVLTMTLGAVLAGMNDLEFSWVGYMWMIINCLFTAAYTLYMRYATSNITLTKFGMVYYNNLLSSLILIGICLLRNEFQALFVPGILTPQFILATSIAGICGFGLNFASLWCVSSTSATTYAIVGSLNKIPVTVLGFLIFGAHMTTNGILFLCMATLGGFMFAYSKLSLDK